MLKWKRWSGNKWGYHEEMLDNWLMECDNPLESLFLLSWKQTQEMPYSRNCCTDLGHLTLVSLTQNLTLNSYLLCFNRKGVNSSNLVSDCGISRRVGNRDLKKL